ncbi:hypothetical protein [Streptomyces sp. NPDC088816]|uniref:hypothetical protein n=1 Tax=Streptomyces sp. NPDC088816 TaxID=3365906 RepID=UPI003805C149
MPYIVTVKAGLVDVVLPGNIRVQGGESVRLTDAQFHQVTNSARAALFTSVQQVDVPISKEYVDTQDALLLPRAGGTVEGDLAVGGGLTVAGTEVSGTQAGDVGLRAWTFDPASITGGSSATVGTLFLCAVYLRRPTTVSGVWFALTSGASGLTAGQSFVGLYSASGVLLTSALLDSMLTGTTARQVAIAPQSLSAGTYWVALLVNATTAPNIASGEANSAIRNTVMNLGLSPSQYRYAVAGTGLTSLPSTITPPNNSSTGIQAFWFGLS